MSCAVCANWYIGTMDNNIFSALLLSFLAGSATALGGALSFFIKKENLGVLAVGLGFSSGVMIYVSFMELLPDAHTKLGALYGAKSGAWAATGLFFAGILVAAAIDRCLPSHHVEKGTLDKAAKLKQMGLFTALVLILHNFPEGLATFAAGTDNLTLGVSVAVAVAVHNIPEGIAVALPVFHASGSRKKAFLMSALSGLAEPAGALIGFMVLRFFLKEAVLGILFAGVAGIMVYLALDELLPTAHEYGDGHRVILGVIGGMAIMALTLLVF